MAKKKTQIPTEFEDILNNIYTNGEQFSDVTNLDKQDLFSNTFVDDDTKIDDPDDKKTDDVKDDVTDPNAKDDDSKIPDDILNNKTGDDDTSDDDANKNEDDITDQQLIEALQVGALFDAVGESLGWNMADIEENDRPLTVEDLTNYLKEVVTQNSIPQYSDDRVRQLDEYISNGGNFEDFYSKQQESISFDNLDMEDESNQKAVVREFLKYQGYTDSLITNKINRYEDNDMLGDEAEESLSRLKQIREQEIENAKRQQEEFAKLQAEQSKAFFNSVTNDINNLTDIRGIAIPKEDRKALFDYIFKVDEDGISQYQKDFNKNLSKNLIESAYFTMKADTFISKAKKEGETSAAERLRKMLRHSSKDHTAYVTRDKQKSVVELASKFF